MALGTRPAGTCHSPVSAASPTWQGRPLELERPSVFPAWPPARLSGALQSVPRGPGPTHPLSLTASQPHPGPLPATPHSRAPHLVCSPENSIDAPEVQRQLPPGEKARAWPVCKSPRRPRPTLVRLLPWTPEGFTHGAAPPHLLSRAVAPVGWVPGPNALGNAAALR